MHLAENRTTGNLRVSLVDDTVLLNSHEPEFCHYYSQFRGHMIASFVDGFLVRLGGVGLVLMEYF